MICFFLSNIHTFLNTGLMKYNLHIIKFTNFKSSLVSFGKCIQSSNHHHNQDTEYFCHPKILLSAHLLKGLGGKVILLAFSWAKREKLELISTGSQNMGQLDSLEGEWKVKLLPEAVPQS